MKPIIDTITREQLATQVRNGGIIPKGAFSYPFIKLLVEELKSKMNLIDVENCSNDDTSTIVYCVERIFKAYNGGVDMPCNRSYKTAKSREMLERYVDEVESFLSSFEN